MRRFRWLLPAIWAALIFWGTSVPQSALPVRDVDVVPKVSFFHIAAYAGLALLIAVALRHLRPWRTAALAFVIAIAFGTVDEWHQRFVMDRHAELADWSANVVGALIGALVYVGAASAVRRRAR